MNRDADDYDDLMNPYKCPFDKSALVPIEYEEYMEIVNKERESNEQSGLSVRVHAPH